MRGLSEFGLVELIRRGASGAIPVGWEGIGDDCAVLPWREEGAENTGKSLLLTTDMLVEGIHFRREWTTPYQLGVKALGVNLSDIAAMGGRPVASLLATGLPPGVDAAWCEDLLNGYHSLGVPLIGGDTSASKQGIVLSVTALGVVENQHIKRRSGARVGDLVGVTGSLGDAAGGLKAIQTAVKEADSLLNRLHTPVAHLREGAWLGAQPMVHAMMDVSDGVAGDLRHILRASGVSARIELDKLPVSADLQRIASKNGWDIIELAVAGGEDYVLLFTFDPSLKQTIEDQGFHVIGEIISSENPGQIDWLGGSGKNFDGYRHF